MRECHPVFLPLAAEWLRRCAAKLCPVLVVETRRSLSVAEAYYARGREPISRVNDLYRAAGLPAITIEENQGIVTKARPGESLHCWGLALDAVPIVDGKPDWKYDPEHPADLFDEIAHEATNLGLVWGGNWRTFKDRPHIEYAWHGDTDEAMRWLAEHGGEWRIPVA